MRTIFRILGTWLLAVALILLIIDGTKSLAASSLVITSVSQLWLLLHAPSFEASSNWLAGLADGLVLNALQQNLLNWPAWAVLGVPGIILALAGKTRATRIQNLDQI